MTEPLWRPSPGRIAAANLTRFCRQVGQTEVEAADMASLYRWSIAEPEAFWRALWDFAGIVGEGPGKVGIENPGRMPGAHFFPEARLNYAENLLRRRDDADALVFWGEDKVKRRLSHRQLYDLVSRLAQAMKAAGVGPGDRVAGFVPNMPETIAAMLATASLGAIWSSCSPDFGVQGVLDRFGQIAPKLLITADGYWYGGKSFDSLARIGECLPQLPSVERVIVLPYLSDAPDLGKLPQGGAARGFHRPLPRRADRIRPPALQSSALHHVFLGHDRRAEMHRAWGGRHADPACEGASAPQRHQERRPAVLFHHLRLDDVELAGLGPGLGRDLAALRRLALPSRRQHPVRLRPGRALHLLRHLGEIHRRLRQGGAEAAGDP